MDNLVVDSSVVIKWFTDEPFSAEAHRILSDYQNGALGLYAPDLLYAEGDDDALDGRAADETWLTCAAKDHKFVLKVAGHPPWTHIVL